MKVSGLDRYRQACVGVALRSVWRAFYVCQPLQAVLHSAPFGQACCVSFCGACSFSRMPTGNADYGTPFRQESVKQACCHFTSQDTPDLQSLHFAQPFATAGKKHAGHFTAGNPFGNALPFATSLSRATVFATPTALLKRALLRALTHFFTPNRM